MRHGWIIGIGLAIGLGCATSFAETGKALIQGTAEGSSVSGTAMLADGPDGLEVAVRVTDVPPGKHGLHIHQYGDCADAGQAAGGHFNPDGAPHGFLPSDDLTRAHPGDLGNIDIGQDGSGVLVAVLPGVSLSGGPYSVAGRAIILHERPDDFSQPTGNAGGRIGCGAIVIIPPEAGQGT